MKLQQEIDHSTLSWVKNELDLTLKQAIEALEAYSEDRDDSSQMRFCATYLHQVQGTLRMVELYGAALLVEEMEQLAVDLLEGQIDDEEAAFEILMRGMVQLPDYLDRLLSGHRDIPVVFLPLVNEIRALRGQSLASEGALFNPDLSLELPDDLPKPKRRYADKVLRPNIARLRTAYQVGLLKWFRDGASDDLYRRMGLLFDRLLSVSTEPSLRQVFWATGGVIEALQNETLELSNSVKSLFGKVDVELRNLARFGERHFSRHRPEAVLNNLLYYIAHAKAGSPLVDRIKDHYKLDSLLPKQEDIEHAQGSMTGQTRAVLSTVGTVLKEELLGVKEQLDLMLRKPEASAKHLAELLPTLQKVRETLAMLGIGYAQSTVEDQINRIKALQEQNVPIAETDLLEIAGSLLTVESALDDHIQSLGQAEHEEGQEPEESAHSLPSSEVQQLMERLLHEVNQNLSAVKESLVRFIEAPWDHKALEGLPAKLEEVSGALRMLEMEEPAVIMRGVGQYVQKDLLDKQQIPSTRQLELLADAIAGMEYFMEALIERRSPGNVLSHIAAALEALREKETAGSALMEDAPQADDALTFSEDLLQDDASPPEPDMGLMDDSDGHATESEPEISEETGDELPEIGVLSEPDDESVETEFEITVSEDDFDLDNEQLDLDGSETETQERLAPEPEMPVEAAERDSAQADQSTATPAPPLPLELPEEAKAIDIPDVMEGEADDDIIEVFSEEMEEAIPNLKEQLEAWKTDPENEEALASMRRAFHTLKGSGRLVGAKRTGEYSWHIENMLNRLIEGTIEADANLKGLMDVAVLHTIPALYRQLTSQGEGPDPDSLRLQMHMADQLAEGKPIDESWLAMLNGESLGKPEAGPELTTDEEIATEEMAQTSQSGEKLEESAQHDDIFTAVPVEVETEGELQLDQDTQTETSAEEPPRVDDELLAIFETEAGNHLRVLKQWLEQLDPNNPQVSEEARVAAHTLNGAASMTEVDAISELTSPLEGVLKRLCKQRMQMDDGTLQLVQQAVQVLETQLQQLVQHQPVSEETALRDQLEALKNSLPVHAQPPDTEEDSEENWGLDVRDQEASAEDLNEEENSDFSLDELDLEQVDFDALELTIGDEADVLASLDEATEALEGMEPFEEGVEAADASAQLDSSTDVMDANHEINSRVEHSERLSTETQQEDNRQENLANELPDEDTVMDQPAHEESQEAGATVEITSQQPGPDPSETDDFVARAEHEPEPRFEAEPEPTENTDEEVQPPGGEPMDAEQVEQHKAGHPYQSEEAETAVPAAASKPESETEPVADTGDTQELLDVDQELVAIFLEEAEDVARDLDQALENWQQDVTAREPVDALQRSLHTLKGGARTIGLDEIGELAHQMESVLMAIQQESIAPDEACLNEEIRAYDHLQENIDRVRQQLKPQIDVELLARLKQLAQGVEAAPDEAAEALREELLLDRQAELEAAQEADLARPHLPEKEADKPGADSRAPSSLVRPKLKKQAEESLGKQELVRVRSDLLGKLVDFAGEVSIYRSRLEQQMGDFRFNLDELQQTVVRLRDQLRKLEIETEAQILSRYQREHQLEEGSDESFDPLELDRFSTLQQLSRALSESVNDLVSIQETLDVLTRESETLLLQQSRVSTELQEGLMKTRMVSFDTLVPRLRRIVRQTASELGKQAVLRVEGTEGEMDRNILERITAPLEHTLRNAVAHGIESPEQRKQLGKSEKGEIFIRVSRDATDVVLEISDDGAGIDVEKVRAKAIAQGLISEETQLSEQETFSLIMESGFSTVDEVSQIAGRGVGMDVVSTELKQLGGTIAIESERNQGTTFTIRLPFTLAVTQSILVKVSDSTYAIPLASVEAVLRMPVDEFAELMQEEPPEIVYGGREHEVHVLADMMGMPESRASDMIQVPILVARAGDQTIALKVDGIVGNREIVVKPVGPQISTIAGIFGATIMGDGSVVLILDIGALARQGKMLVHRPQAVQVLHEQQDVVHKPVVMVVDDSITMRKVTTRVLERQDYEVFTAKDGLDALEQLQDRQPDLVLLDIEMPRMDGYELATHMRNDERLKKIPIIMITSRTGEKHRQRAMDLGVQKYLGKPYQEEDLLREVKDTLEQEAH